MNKDTTYFFIGIKGTGMASLALILHDLGYKVAGSDITQTTFTQGPLEKAGIPIKPFNTKNIHKGLTIIGGNSFNNQFPEIKKALQMKLPFFRYHVFLGKLLDHYDSVGIAGTHGKTSTTGMLSHVLYPITKMNYLIGDGRGFAQPKAKYFIYEADEYRNHFLATRPNVAILNNCDYDHVDCFPTVKDYFNAFQNYANQVKDIILLWGEDKKLSHITAKQAKIYTFGTKPDDDFQATNVVKSTQGSKFDATYKGQKLGTFSIKLFGSYNILHALAVVAYCYLKHINLALIKKGLSNYTGEKRRYAHHHTADMEIIDDYAHVPNEIKATLEETKQQYPNKKIIVVFQPHTYSRVKRFMKGFGKILSKADAVYVTKIYGSPREHSGDVNAQDIVNLITKPSMVIQGEDMKPLLKYHHEVVVFMGAGDIPKYEHVYEKLLKKYHKTEK